MIIEKNTKTATFGELKIGDVFRFNGDIYIRIPYYTTDTGYDFDAYSLSNDDIYNFNNYKNVERIKAKLVIE